LQQTRETKGILSPEGHGIMVMIAKIIMPIAVCYESVQEVSILADELDFDFHVLYLKC